VQQTLSPYATAGVAIVGAGLVAVTPVAAPVPNLSDFYSRAVQLTANGDAFIDQFNDASDNLQQIAQNFGLAPFVGLQQGIVNGADHLQDFFDDPSNLPDITQETQDNLKTVLTGFTGIDMSDDTRDVVFDHTLEGLRATLIPLLPGLLPSDLGVDPDTVSELLGFLASPLSGILIGMAGPFVSPFVALANSIDDGDGFSDTLANTAGAFFNGADLDLDDLIPAIKDADVLPSGFDLNHLDLALGGLFSPGDISQDDYGVVTSFPDGDGNFDTDTVTPVGGSIFNSLGIDASGVPVVNDLDLDSHAVGPLGALIGASETIGVLLGDGWDESGGKGEPSGPATPPLTHLDLPQLPDGFFGDGDDGGATSTEATTPLSDMLSGDGDTFGDLFNGLF
jgi:hypothetical protein